MSWEIAGSSNKGDRNTQSPLAPIPQHDGVPLAASPGGGGCVLTANHFYTELFLTWRRSNDLFHCFCRVEGKGAIDGRNYGLSICWYNIMVLLMLCEQSRKGLNEYKKYTTKTKNQPHIMMYIKTKKLEYVQIIVIFFFCRTQNDTWNIKQKSYGPLLQFILFDFPEFPLLCSAEAIKPFGWDDKSIILGWAVPLKK